MARYTVHELSSELMTDAEKETETERLVRKSKQQPFIPIGELIFVDRSRANYHAVFCSQKERSISNISSIKISTIFTI